MIKGGYRGKCRLWANKNTFRKTILKIFEDYKKRVFVVFYLFSDEDTMNIPAALNMYEYPENNKKRSRK
jgi:hypothetical protein